ncbi:MBF complex negative regulatory component yox1 [Colletotrichum siamense]|uniref:MBF complex negative regulatory component yox1 n=1 Tax=Colletotrichum siamense TaxID=690259 RepID=UPI001872D1E7|nr:MBF complex negative regulatory component yox1 [Colletotrichum siamense]KAF5515195.1 MBF complex negative regulatory component yox1 [Colletotrichum siamense]
MPASDTSPPVPTAAPATSPPSSSDSFSQLEHSAPDLIISSSDLATSSATSKTIVNGAEPEKHPKGKRKRTAAKDKSILENAYLANPKPDKAARLDIVKRVSLNEKEVQIWFQNRRQNDRRKSRPLSAQEIAALRYGGMQILSSDPASYSSPVGEDKTSPIVEAAATSSASAPMETPVKPVHTGAKEAVDGSRTVSPSHGIGISGDSALKTPSTQQSDPASQPQTSSSFSFSSSIGLMSKRWNPASSFSTPSTLDRRVDDTPRPTDEKEPARVKVNMLVSPSGDSDKENWLPDEEGNARRISPAGEVGAPLPTTAANKPNARRTGRILQGHPGPVIFSGNRARTMPAMGRRDSGKDMSIFEDDEGLLAQKPADEVEIFMRGEVSPGKKGDMDCIAGLLSLSQGNWR